MTDNQLKIFLVAIEACKKIDEFQSECMSGHPIVFQSNGLPINHAALNEAYDLAYTVLQEVKNLKKDA